MKLLSVFFKLFIFEEFKMSSNSTLGKRQIDAGDVKVRLLRGIDKVAKRLKVQGDVQSESVLPVQKIAFDRFLVAMYFFLGSTAPFSFLSCYVVQALKLILEHGHEAVKTHFNDKLSLIWLNDYHGVIDVKCAFVFLHLAYVTIETFQSECSTLWIENIEDHLTLAALKIRVNVESEKNDQKKTFLQVLAFLLREVYHNEEFNTCVCIWEQRLLNLFRFVFFCAPPTIRNIFLNGFSIPEVFDAFSVTDENYAARRPVEVIRGMLNNLEVLEEKVLHAYFILRLNPRRITIDPPVDCDYNLRAYVQWKIQWNCQSEKARFLQWHCMTRLEENPRLAEAFENVL